MGFELDQFLDPDNISPELICPICCGVLERPVQTSSEHLFCEDELLEWMERSDMCPVTNTKLDPSQIRKPSRVIVNILGALQIKCSNHSEGCTWIGKLEGISEHIKSCIFRPREQLCEMLEKKSIELEVVKKKYSALKVHCRDLEEENACLIAANETLQRQVKVYDAFIKNKQDEGKDPKEAFASSASRKDRSSSERAAHQPQHSTSSRESDLQVINRLRLLEEKIAESSRKG